MYLPDPENEGIAVYNIRMRRKIVIIVIEIFLFQLLGLLCHWWAAGCQLRRDVGPKRALAKRARAQLVLWNKTVKQQVDMTGWLAQGSIGYFQQKVTKHNAISPTTIFPCIRSFESFH